MGLTDISVVIVSLGMAREGKFRHVCSLFLSTIFGKYVFMSINNAPFGLASEIAIIENLKY